MVYQLKKLARYCLLIIITFVLLVFCYLRFGGYIFTTKEVREQLFKDRRSAPQLPDNFLQVYKTVYPKALENNGWHYLFSNIVSHKQIESPSVEIAILYGQTRMHGSFCYFVQYNFMIQDNITQEQCLNKILQIKDFRNDISGIEEASKRYFNKSLKKLNDTEILEIITRIKNPHLYNKQKRAKLFEDRFNMLKNQFEKNKSEH